MSSYSEQFIQQVGNYVASLMSTRPANPTTATISSASINPETGARAVLVSFNGATDIPTVWGSAFDMAIQVVAGGDMSTPSDYSKLRGVEVLLVTSTSPPYISDMIVRS